MRVLVLDNEEWTVSGLLEVLRARNFEVDYVSTLDDAVYQMHQQRYDAVVTDFEIDLLDGKRVLRIIKGYFDYECETDVEEICIDEIRDFDEETADVLEEHFEGIEDYIEFVNEYKSTILVLFSGTQYGDDHNEPILNNVLVVQKKLHQPADDSRLEDHSPETEIADYIDERFGDLEQ